MDMQKKNWKYSLKETLIVILKIIIFDKELP